MPVDGVGAAAAAPILPHHQMALLPLAIDNDDQIKADFNFNFNFNFNFQKEKMIQTQQFGSD